MKHFSIRFQDRYAIAACTRHDNAQSESPFPNRHHPCVFCRETGDFAGSLTAPSAVRGFRYSSQTMAFMSDRASCTADPRVALAVRVNPCSGLNGSLLHAMAVETASPSRVLAVHPLFLVWL
jgi:hypothetical protein